MPVAFYNKSNGIEIISFKKINESNMQINACIVM